MPGEKTPAGREWVRKSDGDVLRVLAFADGWVMVRHKGCMPFTLMYKELKSDYEPKEPIR